MYQIREIRAGRSESTSDCSFVYVIYCLRSVGREPGRLASSTESAVSTSASSKVLDGRCVAGILRGLGSSRIDGSAGPGHGGLGSRDGEGNAEVGRFGKEGSLGCDIEFWPGMVSPLASPAQMWCVKLVLMAGRTEMEGGRQHILLRR